MEPRGRGDAELDDRPCVGADSHFRPEQEACFSRSQPNSGAAGPASSGTSLAVRVRSSRSLAELGRNASHPNLDTSDGVDGHLAVSHAVHHSRKPSADCSCELPNVTPNSPAVTIKGAVAHPSSRHRRQTRLTAGCSVPFVRNTVLHRIALLLVGILIGAALNSMRVLHTLTAKNGYALSAQPPARPERHSAPALYNDPLAGGHAVTHRRAALFGKSGTASDANEASSHGTSKPGSAKTGEAPGTAKAPEERGVVQTGSGTGLRDAAEAARARDAGLKFTDKLGMPGDSDDLPNVPLWNASAWHGPARVAPTSEQWPNTAAICAIMRSEAADDVAEWLDYHRWIGVDKVYLRENAATVPKALRQRLQPYVDSGFLDLNALPGPKHPLQNRWYNRCSKPDMAGQHSWVAFVDLDEYIVVLEDGVAAREPHLKDVLRDFKGNAGLSLQWVIFGSSGHVERPTPGGPLAYYHQCTGELSFQMKCMANMYYATHHMMVGNTVHDCTYRLDEEGFDAHPVTLTNGFVISMGENTPMTNPSNDTALGRSRTYRGHLEPDVHAHNKAITPGHRLALFHFVTRSLDDYAHRKVKLPSGIYTHNYVQHSKKAHSDVADPAAFAVYEHDNGFDGQHPVCSSAVEARYADVCCRGVLGPAPV